MNLDGDPPLEIRVTVTSYVYGFSFKLDSGRGIEWGTFDLLKVTEWLVLGGPVIGFYY